MKFEDAFSLNKREIVTLDDINQWYKNEKFFFKNEISGRLVCPECKKARLKYNNAKNPYLSCYPNSAHEDNCSLKQKEYSKTEIEKLVNAGTSKEIISRQIESVFTNLFRINDDENDNNDQPKEEQIEKKEDKNQIKIKHKKRIPRKNINVKITEKDYDEYKIFYGTVKIIKREVNKKNNKHYYFRLLDNNESLIFDISVTEKVYQYLPNYMKNNDEFKCNIAFFAKLTYIHEKAIAILRHSDYLIMSIL